VRRDAWELEEDREGFHGARALASSKKRSRNSLLRNARPDRGIDGIHKKFNQHSGSRVGSYPISHCGAVLCRSHASHFDLDCNKGHVVLCWNNSQATGEGAVIAATGQAQLPPTVLVVLTAQCTHACICNDWTKVEKGLYSSQTVNAKKS
jgi:hypothetical protein